LTGGRGFINLSSPFCVEKNEDFLRKKKITSAIKPYAGELKGKGWKDEEQTIS